MESLKSVILIGLLAVGFVIIKTGKLGIKLLGIKIEKGGYYCHTCGERIIQGRGVVLADRGYFFCVDCVKLGRASL
jgi:late competence protein required for DNA uptake (superfamily II DNA/RNA helicase)